MAEVPGNGSSMGATRLWALRRMEVVRGLPATRSLAAFLFSAKKEKEDNLSETISTISTTDDHSSSRNPSLSLSYWSTRGRTESLEKIDANSRNKQNVALSISQLLKHRSELEESSSKPASSLLFNYPEILRLLNFLKFQSVFVIVLMALWSVLISSYLSLVDPFQPRINGNSSLLSTPGLAIRPLPEDHYSTLISFRHGGSGNWQILNSRILEFLESYTSGKRAGGSLPCNFDTVLTKDFRCHVANRKWMALDTDIPCTSAEMYGMYHGQPCVILKMNKLYGWEPQPYYNLSEIQELAEMPGWLKDRIVEYWDIKCQGRGDLVEQRCPEMRMVWLSCEGETAADQEHMGNLSYSPWQGFPGFYYPYLNQQNYLSPLIFVQFRSITPGVVIQVRCKIWAKNIEHDPDNPRKGGIHFEILMD